jgi:uncharacterized protein YdeI (YjbR/CyaY-like superfamily)
MPEPPRMRFASPSEWEAWLSANHADADGVWLELSKAGRGMTTVTHQQAVEVALCFGWIDGQAASVDEASWLQKFTPRRPRSRWSKVNRDRATALITAGRMRPAGLAEVERAKQDGRWEAAYDSPSTATVPPDLSAALDADPQAREFFAGLDSRNRYAILYRIQEAKQPETRARRIAKYVAMLHNGQQIYP